MKRIVALAEYCLGCGLCAVYCSALHTAPDLDLVRAFRQPKRLAAGITVEKNLEFAVARSCRHCENPYCVESCITGAMVKDPLTGEVWCDVERCVACWTCVAACPYGMVTISQGPHDQHPHAQKCDLCRNLSEVPVCVLKCPNEALVLVEEEGVA